MKKLCMTLALLLALLPAANVAAEAADRYGAGLPFTDVDKDDYFYEAVAWAYTNGVTTGTSETTFSPGATCTRGQVVTFLWRAMGEPEPKGYNNSPFMDVDVRAYYYKPVLWAVEQGITTGTSDWLFSPDDTCTYGHILTFLHRANGKPAGKTTDLTASWPDGLWYKEAISWADDSGLLGILRDGFDPTAFCPRGDTVEFLFRNADGEPVQSAKPAPLLDQIAGKTFYFESGVGGWDTQFTVDKDGNVKGRFHDSDVGMTGEGYPNGTMQESVFTGRLTDIKVLADGVYEATLVDQATAKAAGTEEIIDGVLHIYTKPYGIEVDIGQTLTFYAPGRPTAGMADEVLRWLHMNMSVPEDAETLPCWVVCDWNSEDCVTFYAH